MALPTLSSRWAPAGIEKRWQSIHEHHHNHQKRWNDVVKYHNENALRSSWSTRQSKLFSEQGSVSVHPSRQQGKKETSNIHSRRRKLSEMLKKERTELERELSNLKIHNSSSNLDLIKDRTEELRSARTEKNRKIAEEKLYQHWKMNNPDLRALDYDLHREHVKEAWKAQSQHKQAYYDEEKENDRQFANEYEEARVESLKNMRMLEEQRRKAEKERAVILKQQIQELEQRAKETERLQLEEARLHQEQLQLEQMEEERKQIQKHAEKRELGTFLHRQYKAQMRNRAREVQDELQLDREILGRILEEERKEDELKSARQEKAKQDVAWMKSVMEEQLKLERRREAELDLMYREEARQVWEQRESVWKKEREAREQLVREVLDERAAQLAEKLLENKQKQEDLVKERSNLIAAMDAAKLSSRQDEEARENQKLQQRDDLERQVTSRREKTARMRDEVMEEMEAQKEAEKGYKEFLEAETYRRRAVGYQPQQYGRRRVAWD